MSKGKEAIPMNFVHQNAILCETIQKEQRHQKLHKDYRVNPFKKSEYLESHITAGSTMLGGEGRS